jgi:acetate kinase
MSHPGSILTLNAGSSSVKFALFTSDPTTTLQVRGEIESLDQAPHLYLHDFSGTVISERLWPAGDIPSFAAILEALLDLVNDHLGVSDLAAVGHRIVHGGSEHSEPAIVTPHLLSALEALTPLDPIHLPHNLTPIHAIAQNRPDLIQVVCFDTAFHHTMPPEAAMFALPANISKAGVRRFGFHGLSYEFIAGELRRLAPALAAGRVIVAHLGSGASLCALANGRSIATTMGFSTLDGLVMSTRCGSLDPGVIFYLARMGHSLPDIEDMLYRRSGLLGVSGISSDIRVLLAAADPSAEQAIDLFTYGLACDAASMVSALGGLDGFVFTAGIGLHSATVRTRVCDRLGWLGLKLDPDLNEAGAMRISASGSRVDVRVIATDEELMIARHTQSLIHLSGVYP